MRLRVRVRVRGCARGLDGHGMGGECRSSGVPSLRCGERLELLALRIGWILALVVCSGSASYVVGRVLCGFLCMHSFY